MAAEKAKKARVLEPLWHEGELRQPNQIIVVTSKDETALAGRIDTDPAAVKFAESL